MKWSFKIGKLAGIDVYIHVTFILLVVFLGFLHSQERGAAAGIDFVIFLLAAFGCIVLHELGHALTARKYGIKTRDITLYPIGGVARLERMPDKPMQEFWVAVAGPAVNVVLAAALYVLVQLTGGFQPSAGGGFPSGSFLERLLVVNVALVLFNLIPAFPMDGGRVLRALLATRMDYTRATGIAGGLGQIIAFGFIALGLMGGGVVLMFIGFFVFLGAAQETSYAQMKEAFGGIPVSDAMVRDFKALEPGSSLADACQLIIDGTQTDFPVVWNARVLGILTRGDLIAALASRGKDAVVSEVMRREFQTVDAGEMLDTVFARMQTGNEVTLPVMSQDRLVGLLTTENLAELFMIRRALKGYRPPAGSDA